MYETSKSIIRRSYDRRYAVRYLVGRGIDIGCGNDSIGSYQQLFPLIKEVVAWDLPQGDATFMESVEDDSFDFVHSSHCLEHVGDAATALKNWIRICRPGGYLLIIVPDEDLYEQGEWPSTYNADHKCSFTIGKAESWCPQSVNLIDLLTPLLDRVEILKLELLDNGYFYHAQRFDQTLTVVGESAIEIILRKRLR